MSQYDIDQVSQLEPGYLDEYGLRQAPFSQQHDDAFLYLDAERRQRLNMLSHLTQYSNLLLIVTGERGIGKTSLMHRYIKQADDNWRICEVNAHTMMDAETLLNEIAAGFGVSGLPGDIEQMQESIFQYLRTLQNDDDIPILLLDDAHELPKEALETLFYFADIEAAQGHLLRIILFCEPQIEIMLEAPAIRPLRERITHTMDIPAFEEEQTAEYIKHRMAVAGFEGNSPFTPKVIKKLHRISRGIPSHINELAHLHLSDSSSSGLAEPAAARPDRQRTFSHRQIALGSIMIIVVVLALAMQDSINQWFEADQPLPAANTVAPLAEPAGKQADKTVVSPPAVTELVLKDRTDNREPTDKAPDTLRKTAEAGATTTQEQAVFADPAPDSVPDKTAPADRIMIASISPNPVTGSNKPQTLTLAGSGFLPDDGIKPDVEVSWQGKNKQPVVKQLAPHQIDVIDDSTLKIHITTGTNPDRWTVRVKAGKLASEPYAFTVGTGKPAVSDRSNKTAQHTAQTKPAPAPANKATTTFRPAAKWIMSRDPTHFTLQLLGTSSRASLEAFIRRHRLRGDVSIYQTLRDGKPWYALVYGEFSNRAQAKAASKRLPASMRKVKPWIRRFDSVQAQIVTETKAITATRPGKYVSGSRLDKQNHVAWLWSQSPNNFTLQLLGSRNEAAIVAFIKKHNLIGQAKYFHTRYDTRDWYTLVYGVYPNRQAAQRAIGDLPPALQKVSPWPRSFASIHKDLYQSSQK